MHRVSVFIFQQNLPSSFFGSRLGLFLEKYDLLKKREYPNQGGICAREEKPPRTLRGLQTLAKYSCRVFVLNLRDLCLCDVLYRVVSSAFWYCIN